MLAFLWTRLHMHLFTLMTFPLSGRLQDELPLLLGPWTESLQALLLHLRVGNYDHANKLFYCHAFFPFCHYVGERSRVLTLSSHLISTYLTCLYESFVYINNSINFLLISACFFVYNKETYMSIFVNRAEHSSPWHDLTA